MFPRLEGPRRRNYSAPSNSMQPRGFLRMHIFMDGMRIVWRACRCSVDATRIYSRASKRKGARSARARSTPRAPIDPPPSAGLSCSTTGSPSLRVSPPRVHLSSVPKDAGETSGGGMEREPFSILLRVLRSCRCDTRRETTSSSTLSLLHRESISPFVQVRMRKGARKTRIGDIFFMEMKKIVES